MKPLKKSSLGVIASEAKQSQEIAAAPPACLALRHRMAGRSGPRNDFFRGFNIEV